MNNIKYIKRIDTTNKTNTYIDGQTLEFVLPKNKQDLSSFKIFFDVEIDPVYEYDDGSYLKRFMPRLTSSIIDTMTLTKDAEEFQTIKDYNVIFNIINDATNEIDNIDSNRPDTLNYCLIDDNNNAKILCDFNNSKIPEVKPPLKYRCFITSFLGFLGEHSSSILDCSKHEYKIAITLAPKYITYRGIENTNVKASFNGGAGSGASAEVVLDTIVSRIEVVNGNLDYTTTPTITLTGNTYGSGATAEAILDDSPRGIDANFYIITSVGSGYNPTLTVAIDFNGGGGTGATGYGVVAQNGAIDHIVIDSSGSGYTSLPTATFNRAGHGAGTDATLSGIFRKPIQKIIVTNSGTNYSKTGNQVQVVISGGDGNATGTAIIENVIDSVNIIDGGSGYVDIPYVAFSGGDPSIHAKAVATVVNGVVDSVIITDSGLGYKDLIQISSNQYETDYHYKLTNVFANIDVLPDNTPASSQITFKHYKTIRGTKNNTKNVSLQHNHKGKLNYLMTTFVVLGENDMGLQLQSCNSDVKRFGEYFKENYGDIFTYEETPMTSKTASSKTAKSLSTENNLDNSLYFKRAGSNVKTSQLFMNGMAITPAMDIPQIYNVAKEFFNNSMNRVKSLASFENEFFVFPMMINQEQEDYSSEIEWICSAGERQDFNAYPILILCADKTIDV